VVDALAGGQLPARAVALGHLLAAACTDGRQRVLKLLHECAHPRVIAGELGLGRVYCRSKSRYRLAFKERGGYGSVTEVPSDSHRLDVSLAQGRSVLLTLASQLLRWICFE